MIDELAARCGVELVRWPEQRVLRDRLACAGVPRLLITADGYTDRLRLAPDEAVIAASSTPAEAADAIRRLADAVATFDQAAPWIDADGTLHRGPASVSLTPTELRITSALLAAPGSVVSRRNLQQMVAEGHLCSARALEAAIYRLRRRLVDIHLVVRTVRGRGFTIETGVLLDH